MTIQTFLIGWLTLSLIVCSPFIIRGVRRRAVTPHQLWAELQLIGQEADQG